MDAFEYGSRPRTSCISIPSRDLFCNRQRQIDHNSLNLFTTSARCIRMLLQSNQGVTLRPFHLNSQPNQSHAYRKPHNRWPSWGAQPEQLAGTIRCVHGPKCKYLSTSTCHSYHTEEEVAQSERKWKERFAKMMHGLGHPESLGTAVERQRLGTCSNLDCIGIANERQLASFNKTGDGEIAVPGWSRPYPITTLPFSGH